MVSQDVANCLDHNISLRNRNPHHQKISCISSRMDWVNVGTWFIFHLFFYTNKYIDQFHPPIWYLIKQKRWYCSFIDKRFQFLSRSSNKKGFEFWLNNLKSNWFPHTTYLHSNMQWRWGSKPWAMHQYMQSY